MALLENLGKKITEVGHSATQKAKEMADVASLNASISEEEKRIDNLYFQIGKLFVERHAVDCKGEFGGMVASVREAQAKIADYQEQIKSIKGVVRCEQCGAEVARGVAFCSSCGAPMPKLDAVPLDDTIRCENCGAMVKHGMRFCTSCGKPMTSPAVPDSPSVDVAEEKTAEKVCPNCGAKIESDVAFCTECGTKL